MASTKMLLPLLLTALLGLSPTQGTENNILQGEEEIFKLIDDYFIEEPPEESQLKPQGEHKAQHSEKDENGKKGHGQQCKPCSLSAQEDEECSCCRGGQGGRSGQGDQDDQGGRGSQTAQRGRGGKGRQSGYGGQKGQHERGGQNDCQ